jgi:glycosyltransferase involved in cell wall biosynthesis
MKTKLPVALIYGWDRIGTHELVSDVYYWEGLSEKVSVFSYDNILNFRFDFIEHDPDIIITIGSQLESNLDSINRKIVVLDEMVPDNVLANIIVCQTTFRNSSGIAPKFSIFTPTYKTGERIYRTYESLSNQTYKDWEWIIVDDSPDDETWEKLQEISSQDFRVKPFKIKPITGGIVGMAKNRACHLSDGEWLVELDHDDYLLSNCLEELDKASKEFPDAGFIYSEVCELYDDGEMKYYTNVWGEQGYANPENSFNCGYGIHKWIEIEGEKFLSHRYSDINPLSIRYNFSMPNHVRCWKRDVYLKIRGHNKRLPVADDFELIVRTFLETKFIHVKKLLYLQYNNRNSTVDNNVTDINRRSRLIKDHFDRKIHQRILDLGYEDWFWDQEQDRSFLDMIGNLKYHNDEQVMNYIYL